MARNRAQGVASAKRIVRQEKTSGPCQGRWFWAQLSREVRGWGARDKMKTPREGAIRGTATFSSNQKWGVGGQSAQCSLNGPDDFTGPTGKSTRNKLLRICKKLSLQRSPSIPLTTNGTRKPHWVGGLNTSRTWDKSLLERNIRPLPGGIVGVSVQS